MTHPSEITLLDYIENKLSDRERERIKYHLRFCSDCLTALSMAQNLPSEKELDKIEVPKEWVERAKRIGSREKR